MVVLWDYTCDRHPRWAWVLRDREILTHQLPGWNRVPPAYDGNYLTEGEVNMVKFMLEESSMSPVLIRGMIKKHLRI